MGRLALVTGGKGTIGTAICRALADDGHTVVATENETDAITTEEWLAQQEADGYRFGTAAADVADFASCEQAAAFVKDKFGTVEILVNCAGITRDTMFRKMTLEQWQMVMRTNLDSVFNMTRPLIDGMLENGWGRIVNIGSINGQKGQFGQTNYSAAKAGVHGFTMALAQETARKGITVNTVAPGYTSTPMVTAMRQEVVDSIVSQIPMGRLAEASEVAAAVRFLCSEEARFISGASLPVNGVQFTSH